MPSLSARPKRTPASSPGRALEWETLLVAEAREWAEEVLAEENTRSAAHPDWALGD